MVRIFICDDSQLICKKNEEDIRRICKEKEIAVAITIVHSGEELLQRLLGHPHDADVILLDILMGGMDGAQVAKKLRMTECSAEIIFLTSSEDYVFDVFEANPVQYIIKGEKDSSKLEKALGKAIELSKKKRTEVFLLETGGEQFQIPYRDILYFEISLRTVDVHYNNEVLQFTSSMKCLKEKVKKKGFVQINRSFLINTRNVDGISRNQVKLIDGEVVPLSPRYLEETEEAFKHFMRKE